VAIWLEIPRKAPGTNVLRVSSSWEVLSRTEPIPNWKRASRDMGVLPNQQMKPVFGTGSRLIGTSGGKHNI
jgi:hypothetical protein